MALTDYRSANRPFGPLGSTRLARRMATLLSGAGMMLALAAPGAQALETIMLQFPLLGEVEVTLDELRTFAATGETSGDLGELLADPTVRAELAKAKMTEEKMREILNAEFGIGSLAARAVPEVVDTCPGQLILGAVSQVVYADDRQGDSSAMRAAITSTAAAASQGKITALDVLAEFEPDLLTIDVSGAIAIFNRLEDRVTPLVDRIGDLTVRQLTDMDSAKLRELLAVADVTDADIANVETAIRAFGTIEAGSDLDKLFEQIDLQALLQKALAGNFTGILGDLGAVDLSGIDFDPYEARVSNLMVALMEVVDLPVNKGPACMALTR
ncbi:MAG: hypothetical protein Fur0042_00500 [Cyanophyceae cyanobacterium]